MISKPTVLILGAGASQEYGFHLGRKLMFEALRVCSDSKLRGLCYDAKIDAAPFSLLANVGPLSQAPSIDTLLEYRTEFAEVGKAAIAYVMIPQEEIADLNMREEQRWYEYLFRRMLDQARTPDDFAKNQLSVVTFNYDRSLEFFLFQALRNMYNINETVAANILKEIPIVHIYGKLGEPNFLEPNGRQYSTLVNWIEIRKCVDGIKVISERGDDSPECQEARNLLEHAERICFLGFGYDATNLKRILPTEIRGRIYGTVLGLGTAETDQAKELLREPLGANRQPPDFRDLRVLDALKEFPVLFD